MVQIAGAEHSPDGAGTRVYQVTGRAEMTVEPVVAADAPLNQTRLPRAVNRRVANAATAAAAASVLHGARTVGVERS